MPSRSARRVRIVVWFPEFAPWRMGGAEFRALRGVRLLSSYGDVTLLTRRVVPLETLNQQYASSLRADEFRLVALDQYFAWLPGNSLRHACRGAMARRYLAKHRNDYDFVVSMLNLVDAPHGGLHMVTDCRFDAGLHRHATGEELQRPPPGRWWRGAWARHAVEGAVQRALGLPRDSKQIAADPRNRLIANSQWMADALASYYGVARPTVLHPPVLAEFPPIAWEDREPGFVVIGRVSPEKRVERIVAIVDAVRRAHHPEIHLHIAGHVPKGTYGDHVRSLVRDKPWITLEGEVQGDAKARLIASHRYALHADRFEPFGIAIAEYVKAGCLPFVPNRGGGAEIVPFDELQYAAEADAAARIAAVLDDPQRQAELRQRLAQHYASLHLEDFDRRFSEIVQQELITQGFSSKAGVSARS